MTIGSIQARLKRVNRNIRLRKKAPFMGLHGPLTLIGVYVRQDYMGFCLDGNDVFVRSKPVHYRKITNILTKEDIVEVASDRRRGRETFIKLLRSKGLIGRAGQQYLQL